MWSRARCLRHSLDMGAVGGATMDVRAGAGAFVPCASIPGLPWHVCYTKPQMELRVELKLRKEGAAAWAPNECWVTPDRHRRLRLIFPRYVLMQMSGERQKWGFTVRNEGGEELGSVLRSPSGRPLVLPDQDLEALLAQCAPNGVIYPPEPREMHRGDVGRVVTGPMTDFRGICRRTTRERVWLLLSVLGRETEVEFKRDAVEISG